MEKTVWYCKDKEHFEHLMKKMEEQGWMWIHGYKPTEWAPSFFVNLDKDGVFIAGTHECKKLYWTSGKEKNNYSNVIHVELPNPKPDPTPGNDPIRPAHYRNGEMDRFEVWYRTLPFNEFRAAMKCVIDRYVSRYDRKDGRKDLRKAIETIKRLDEYEEREGND